MAALRFGGVYQIISWTWILRGVRNYILNLNVEGVEIISWTELSVYSSSWVMDMTAESNKVDGPNSPLQKEKKTKRAFDYCHG